tara:strand:- start:28 stop:1341 length:1314 start_codon:yes stop_codon:yes gene_type:complete
MKFIKFYLTIILCCLLSANTYAEENPDLNPASAGGATFTPNVRSDVDKFLKSMGMKRGRNVKKNGSPYFVFVGDGEISAKSRDNLMIHDSRSAAFNEAFIEAKTNYVKSLGLEITRELSSKTYTNNMPDTMAEDAIKTAVGTDTSSFDKLKKLISVKLDSALKEEGYNPEMADAEKEAIKKKILRSREITNLFTASAQSMISGFQSFKIFEKPVGSERGSITVVALWSPKLNQLAQAIKSGSTNVPKGTVQKPIEEQLKLDDPNSLLASFGTKMYVNENGNLVLVSYGQASPSIENDPGALSTACDIAESRAYENMVTYAREQVMYEEMRKEIDKAETFTKDGMKAYESTNAIEAENLINSKSSMTLKGQSLIGSYPITSPNYKSTSCVAVTQWSAEGVAAANQSRNEMNSTSSSSSSSSNQGDLPTTTDETPSDDF